MSRYRRFEIVTPTPTPTPSSYFLRETSIFAPTKTLIPKPHFPAFPFVDEEIDYALETLNFNHTPSIFRDEFDAITDLIRIDESPFHARATRRIGSDLYLQSLCDRVSDLELGFDRLLQEKRKKKIGERKYTWTAEIKSPDSDRKYKWTAEIKDAKNGKKEIGKSYKLTAEIKGKGGKYQPIERTYTVKVTDGESGSESEKKTKKKSEKVKGNGKPEKSKIVEIEEPYDHGALVLRQVFAKRVEKSRGKRKQVSPDDAAALIQMNFRAYLIRRSQSLRALRELAIAKNKLKELRVLFNNFSYRRRISKDAEERQRFSEKIIVLLLTVDAIEGADPMVRSAKKSMVDELEAMLDVVDPQPSGRSLSMRRRTFDMPDPTINKELAAGVAQVIQMLDQEASGGETFEAFL